MGYSSPIEFCMFPPIILDNVATNIILNFSKRGGNDLCDYDKIDQLFYKLYDLMKNGIMRLGELIY